jgi:hypothetical protein
VNLQLKFFLETKWMKNQNILKVKDLSWQSLKSRIKGKKTKSLLLEILTPNFWFGDFNFCGTKQLQVKN